MEEAKRHLAAGEVFFTKENFALLKYIVTLSDEKKALAKLDLDSLLGAKGAALQKKEEQAILP